MIIHKSHNKKKNQQKKGDKGDNLTFLAPLYLQMNDLPRCPWWHSWFLLARGGRRVVAWSWWRLGEEAVGAGWAYEGSACQEGPDGTSCSQAGPTMTDVTAWIWVNCNHFWLNDKTHKFRARIFKKVFVIIFNRSF